MEKSLKTMGYEDMKTFAKNWVYNYCNCHLELKKSSSYFKGVMINAIINLLMELKAEP